MAGSSGFRSCCLITRSPTSRWRVTSVTSGFQVVRDICLQCKSWTAIAEVPPSILRDKLVELSGKDVDAIVQVGTNLSMIRLAAAAEMWLGKPLIAINRYPPKHAPGAQEKQPAQIHDQEGSQGIKKGPYSLACIHHSPRPARRWAKPGRKARKPFRDRQCAIGSKNRSPRRLL